MKPIHLACALLLTTSSTAAQNHSNETVTSKKPPATSKATNPTQQLPFADARKISVIVLYAPEHAFPQPIGSGVWIGDSGFIATCHHVIAPYLPNGPFKIGLARDPYVVDSATMNINFRGVTSMLDAEVSALDEDTDVAILNTHQSPSHLDLMPAVAFFPTPPQSITPQTPFAAKGAHLKTETPEFGETLLLAGFPIGQNLLVLQTGVATGFFSTEAKHRDRPASALRIMLSLVSNPGNSGGPVLDQQGKVVGLLEGNLTTPVVTDQLGVAYCVWQRLDAGGNPARDPSTGQQLPSATAPCRQNTGISYAVPARFIDKLAKEKNLKLD